MQLMLRVVWARQEPQALLTWEPAADAAALVVANSPCLHSGGNVWVCCRQKQSRPTRLPVQEQLAMLKRLCRTI